MPSALSELQKCQRVNAEVFMSGNCARGRPLDQKILGLALLALLACVACGAGDDAGAEDADREAGGTARTQSSTQGAGDNVIDKGTTTQNAGGRGRPVDITTPGLTNSPASPQDGAIDPDSACATDQREATLTPVNMFIQFDRSGSMDEEEKWPQASAALTQFFRDPALAGMRIALRFFPSDDPVPGCQGGKNGACDIDACREPLVPLAELRAETAPTDAQERLLIQAVADSAPGDASGTPLSAALAGALDWASANQAERPAEKTVVVLVTDGEPNGCDEDIDNIARLAADAWKNHQVATYTIGVEGADIEQMNQIAKAGGTERGFYVNASGAETQLVAALSSIRGRAVACDLPMPTGSEADTTKINVTFTRGDGITESFGKAESLAGCTDGAWYYDDPVLPQKLVLCPDTCNRVQSDPKAKISVVVGCAVQLAVPK